MPISLKFYRDQLLSTGKSSSPLPAAHRLIYIRYGSVIANGATLTQDQLPITMIRSPCKARPSCLKFGGNCRRPTKHRNYSREPTR